MPNYFTVIHTRQPTIGKSTKDKIVALRKDGKTYKEIRKSTKVCISSITKILSYNNLIKVKNSIDDFGLIDEVVKLKKSGKTNKQIGIELKISKPLVSKILRMRNMGGTR